MVLGTGLPCLSLGAQDKYSSDVDAGKQTEALGQSQRSWESATASDFTPGCLDLLGHRFKATDSP